MRFTGICVTVPLEVSTAVPSVMLLVVLWSIPPKPPKRIPLGSPPGILQEVPPRILLGVPAGFPSRVLPKILPVVAAIFHTGTSVRDLPCLSIRIL